MTSRFQSCLRVTSVCLLIVLGSHKSMGTEPSKHTLAADFLNPPASARPWVYWFWMDGNSSREGITADFEAMQRAGIGGVFQMEVDLGIPRGPVPFMSPKWRELFDHAVHEADRLGLKITINAGPGWTGSGGPWVKPGQSMQKVVFSETEIKGGNLVRTPLPQPPATAGFYRDIAVLAFPAPAGSVRIPDIQEKALYHRGHYSSESGVRTILPEPANDNKISSDQVIAASSIVNLSSSMDSSGTLNWNAPVGNWIVMRFGHTSTGANTRPAPQAGLGLECDKMDRDALAAHYAAYMQPLLDNAGTLAGKSLFSLHIDSWEMGPQNWTAKFAAEFKRRRGYDILPWLPVFAGRPIDTVEKSERFLWDLRRTVQELIVLNHADALKELSSRSGMQLSIEPYDGNPICDMQLGSVADIPMCEFWANCFQTWFSCYEATSVAHTYGRPIVAAEAFTSDDAERWLMHPRSMKALGDWAFCRGINRFAFHRYAHQPWLDRAPGMTMGPYGIHYERTQTWWDMVDEYNRYIARCQSVLQQGTVVADVLYLAPEDAPFVFDPPVDAVHGTPPTPRSYNFDCCTPDALLNRAKVVSVDSGSTGTGVSGLRRIAFENGSSYAVLVLPRRRTMSPELLAKIEQLVADGATVIGNPPERAVGLSKDPASDSKLHEQAGRIWSGKPNIVPDTAADSTARDVLPPLAELWSDARWIWSSDEPNAATKAAPGIRYFRRDMAIAVEKVVRAAHFVASADNSFELFVNGEPAGSHADFRMARSMDVARHLHAGANQLALLVKNAGEQSNPAGVIGVLHVSYTDSTSQTLATNHSWMASENASDGWTTSPAAAVPWSAAHELGGHGMPPWNQIGAPLFEPPLFPNFQLIRDTLASRRISPDFQCSADLRYTHRTMGDTDIYFISNPADQWVQATAMFRVTGATAEIWNPLDGTIGVPFAVQRFARTTALPLQLEPAGSRFVIFRRGTATNERQLNISTEADVLTQPVSHDPPLIDLVTSGGRQIFWSDVYSSQAPKPPLAISSAWTVKFQPGRGAPESTTLENLLDLATHTNAAIRHFSGIATYTTRFRLPADTLGTSRIVELDLGQVQVMARVRLNGKPLRTLWKAPYSVDISQAVQAGENELVVEVANLWPNRLIGDSALPEDQRVARTTWNPFKPGDALPKSGLIGPVLVKVGYLR